MIMGCINSIAQHIFGDNHARMLQPRSVSALTHNDGTISELKYVSSKFEHVISLNKDVYEHVVTLRKDKTNIYDTNNASERRSQSVWALDI